MDDFGRVLERAATCCWSPRCMPPAKRRSPARTGARFAAQCARRGLVEPVFVERVDELAESLRGMLRDGDVVLTMGAGNIGAVAQELKAASRREPRHERAALSRIGRPNSPRVLFLYDVPMAKHTSWHVGGPADCSSRRATPRIWRPSAPAAAEMPVLWIGLGSNLLVRDGGIRGAVICDARRARRARAPERNAHPCRGRRALRAHRPAMRQMGIGARGILCRHSRHAGRRARDERRRLGRRDLAPRGRSRCARPPRRGTPARPPSTRSVIAACGDRTTSGSSVRGSNSSALPGVNTDAIRELLDKRKQSQPIGEWSCGSVFTNPPGDHAARLIESAGLKGFRIGDASVSEKHANFIINHGAARAADVEALIAHVQRTVVRVSRRRTAHRSAHRRGAGMTKLQTKTQFSRMTPRRRFRQDRSTPGR
jgi:UDP-N-acetylmuramate dehydrogenase